MNKTRLYLATLSLLSLPAMLLAQETAPTLDVMAVLDMIVNWLFTILLIIAVIFIIIGAYNFITAGGDSEKVNSAKSMIMWALIGVLIAFLARGLVELIRTVVGA